METYDFSLFFLYLPWILLLIISASFTAYFIKAKRTKEFLTSKESKTIEILEERDKAFAATAAINSIILQTLDFNLLIQEIANAIPNLLGYQTGVLAVIDETNKTLKRVAASNTASVVAALKSLEIPFSNIAISLNDTNNYCVRALRENKIYSTTNLYDVLRPIISEENARKVQTAMGTQTTLIFPIYSLSKKPLGTFLVSMDKPENQITEFERQTLTNFVDGVRIALVNANLYTSLEKTTEELRQANEKLKELDKLKDDFVSIASHELRTPMTVIKSYLWMALNKKKMSVDLRKYLNRSRIAVDRLINLVNNMLNVSRIESGRIALQVADVNLIELAKEVLEEVELKAKELKLTLNLSETAKVPVAFCDKEKIREVFLNFVGNAMKFTPAGGRITISFEIKEPCVYTAITDTGNGIAPEDLKKLFTKFGRLQNSLSGIAESRGTGLGLYISKSIITLHHGTIEVKSGGVGKGSQFTFSLPLADTDVARQLAEDAKKMETSDAKEIISTHENK